MTLGAGRLPEHLFSRAARTSASLAIWSKDLQHNVTLKLFVAMQYCVHVL